jgi:hypothetical protein
MKTLADMKKEYDALEEKIEQFSRTAEYKRVAEKTEREIYSEEAIVSNAKEFLENQNYVDIPPCNIIGYADDAKAILIDAKVWNNHFERLHNKIYQRYSRYTNLG